MFQFKSKKFKKFHKKTLTYKNNVIFRQKPAFGTYLVKSQDSFDFTVAQIMVCRSLITKVLKAKNKELVSAGATVAYAAGYTNVLSDFNRLCAFSMPLVPDFTDTSKPKETRMGKGKGAVSLHFFPVKKGKVLFEFRNLNKSLARKCFRLIEPKLPCKLKLVATNY